MRLPDDIEKDIGELTRKIEAIDADVLRKQSECESLKQTNQDAIARSIGKAHQPAAIKVNRDMITQLQAEITDLEAVRLAIQRQLHQVETELELAMLYKSVTNFNEADAAFISHMETINSDLVNVKEVAEKFKADTATLMTMQNPTMIIESVIRDLRTRGLSFRAFIEDGEIKPGVASDNNDYIDEIRNRYRALYNRISQTTFPSPNETGVSLLNTLSRGNGDRLKDYVVKSDAAPTKGFINKTIIQERPAPDPLQWQKLSDMQYKQRMGRNPR